MRSPTSCSPFLSRSAVAQKVQKSLEMSCEFIVFVVGGVRFSIHKRDIEKHPDSFVYTVVKNEGLDGQAIVLERDAELFQFIYAYIVSGCLSSEARSSNDKDLLDAIRVEAEFFGFPELAERCRFDGVIKPLHNYRTIRRFIKTAPQGTLPVEYPIYSSFSFTTPLLAALGSLWAPFCVVGRISYRPHQIFRRDVDLDDLIPSTFGRGTETVLDTAVRDSMEISADNLDPKCLRDIECELIYGVRNLCPNNRIQLKPYKLVVYEEGGHFQQHRDTVRGDGHIGTVVVILDSDYTGGELEITHGGRTEVVTGPYNWVAMYGDCLHKINPVTSGYRMSLIYDIIATGVKDTEDDVGDGDLFWTNYCKRATPADTVARGADAPAIHSALNQELQNLDSVVICLQHMYPACQAVPGFLKGADAVLYEALRNCYDVQVVYCSIYHKTDHEHVTLCGSIFSTFEGGIVHSEDTKLVIPTQIDPERVLDYTPYIEHTGNESQAEKTVYVVTGLQVRRRE
jgi:hypothetical protein